jgi:hypothetical protein
VLVHRLPTPVPSNFKRIWIKFGWLARVVKSGSVDIDNLAHYCNTTLSSCTNTLAKWLEVGEQSVNFGMPSSTTDFPNFYLLQNEEILTKLTRNNTSSLLKHPLFSSRGTSSALSAARWGPSWSRNSGSITIHERVSALLCASWTRPPRRMGRGGRWAQPIFLPKVCVGLIYFIKLSLALSTLL